MKPVMCVRITADAEPDALFVISYSELNVNPLQLPELQVVFLEKLDGQVVKL